MVTFKENSFVIEIPAPLGVIEEWQYTQSQLIDLLQLVNRELTNDSFDSILNMIKHMSPDLSSMNQIVAS